MPVDAYAAVNRGVDRARKDAAYNALRTAYGDEAGDPEAFASLQQTQQRRELQPYAVPAAQANTAATQQKTTGEVDERRKGAQLNAARAVESAVKSGGDWKGILAYSASRLGMSPQEHADFESYIDKYGPAGAASIITALEKHGAPGTALPTSAIQNNEYYNTLGDDESRQRFSNFAAPPVVRTGDVAGSPTTTITPRLGPKSGAPSSATLSSLAQETDAKQQLASAAARGGAVGKGEGEAAVTDLPFSKTQKSQFISAHRAAKQAYDNSVLQIDDALKSADWTTTGLGSLTRIIPGSPAADYVAKIDGIASGEITRTMSELKKMSATGSTGFGSLVSREEDIMGSRLANFRDASSGTAKRAALRTLQSQLKLSWQNAEDMYNEELRVRSRRPEAPTSVQQSNERARDLSALPDDELFKMLDH